MSIRSNRIHGVLLFGYQEMGLGVQYCVTGDNAILFEEAKRLAQCTGIEC